MIRSMTGYARAAVEQSSFSADVEIRAVNHRFLDIHVKLPQTLSSFEGDLRKLLSSRLNRGKVDVLVRVKPKGESAWELEVDRHLVSELARAARGLAEELGVEGNLELSTILAVPQAFNLKEKSFAQSPEIWPVLAQAAERALAELDRMREAEGRALESDLEARTAALSAHVEAIERLSAAGREKKRKDLSERVAEVLTGASLDASAVAMEVARLVEKADIAEEITRFRSHLKLWQSAVAGGEPCGKKLDFIVQELGRETNTIGSKCQDGAITARVIDVKTELERMREQVQNVE